MPRFAFALWFVAGCVLAADGRPTPEMSTADLAATAQQFLTNATSADFPKSDVRVSVNPLDARLRFPACNNLTLTPHGTRRVGRTSITARCDQPQAWAATLTATIEVWRNVAVLVHALPGGATIKADDIEMRPRNLGDLRDSYIAEADRVVGWTVRRPTAADTVLSARQLVAPIAVNKGDEVKIRSGSGPVAVSMNGTALGDGMPGEQIAVRNVQSNRVVKAWVVAPGLVATGPRAP